MKASLPAALLSVAVLFAAPVNGAPCDLPLPPAQVLKQLNELRAQARRCGERWMPAVGPLTWQPILENAARRYAAELSQRNKLSHTGMNGSTMAQRLDEVRYPMRSAGENLASGPESLDELMRLWLGSPGHCENLMAAEFTEAGLACDIQDHHRALPYWVLELGRPRAIRPIRTQAPSGAVAAPEESISAATAP